MAEDERSEEVDATSAKRKQRLRLLALAIFFVGSLVIAKATGVTDDITVESVRVFMDEAGAWGFVGFIAIFAIGELMHIPGMVFVGAAAVAYGDLMGILASYTGAITSVTVSFFVVRLIGGQPLGDIEWNWVKRALARLEKKPIQTVAWLRLVMWMAPPLNYALAMSQVRFRDYFIGSAIAFGVWVPIWVVFFDWIASLPFFGA